MKSPHEIATAYLLVWNVNDDAERVRLLQDWAEDARYRDPMMASEGRDAIAAMIASARGQFPGHRFALAGTPDGHGLFVRFSWSLAPERGAPVAHGTDIVRLDAEGRISGVIGFLDGGGA